MIHDLDTLKLQSVTKNRYKSMTPAESLAGKQAEQLREYLHSIGKHDEAYKVPTYLTNSFHCRVSEEITPFEKQDHEFELFHMIEGKPI